MREFSSPDSRDYLVAFPIYHRGEIPDGFVLSLTCLDFDMAVFVPRDDPDTADAVLK